MLTAAKPKKPRKASQNRLLAKLVIHGAPTHGASTRAAIARWLTDQANTLLIKHDQLACTYSASYFHPQSK